MSTDADHNRIIVSPSRGRRRRFRNEINFGVVVGPTLSKHSERFENRRNVYNRASATRIGVLRAGVCLVKQIAIASIRFFPDF